MVHCTKQLLTTYLISIVDEYSYSYSFVNYQLKLVNLKSIQRRYVLLIFNYFVWFFVFELKRKIYFVNYFCQRIFVLKSSEKFALLTP